MERENFEPVDNKKEDLSLNSSKGNSSENEVHLGGDKILPDENKRGSELANENPVDNIKSELAKENSIFKTSDKNITDTSFSNINKEPCESENKEDVIQNSKENMDPNCSDNKLHIEDKKPIVIQAYASKESLSSSKQNMNEINDPEKFIPSENDNDNKLIVLEKTQINESNNQSEPIANPKSNNKININKPNEETKKESRINIFKKTDITQGSSYDFIFKIALIGDSGIGKTSILIRFVDDVFKNDTTSTIGVDFKLVSFRIEDKLAKMQIWDTCGSERFKALTSSFIKSCSVFVLVFDLTRQKSFLNLENWIKLIKENVNPKLLCLVGNKADMEEQRQVTLEEAIRFSNRHELKYMETSARTNFGIEGLFSYIAEKLYDDTIKMRNLEKESRKSKSTKKNSKAFELGPSANINKEDDKNNKANNDSESDDENSSDDEQKKKGKRLSHKNSDAAKKRKCNC